MVKKTYIDVVLEKPTKDLWTKSLQEILDLVPGSHFGLKPVSMVTKYFFDYSVFDTEDEEFCATSTDAVSQKIAEMLHLKDRVKVGNGIYHWSDKNYNKLAARVKRELGKEFVQYIEPKLVIICEDKLNGLVDDMLDLFKR